MKTRLIIFLMCLFAWFSGADTHAQTDVKHLSWGKVANNMPTEWYNSEQARNIADQLLARQMDCGGWQKNIPYHHLLTDAELAKVRRTGVGATIDNGATTTEMRFLARVYACCGDARYKDAFVKGLHYLFEAQYDNAAGHSSTRHGARRTTLHTLLITTMPW